MTEKAKQLKNSKGATDEKDFICYRCGALVGSYN
jgi:hypothetical protein